jgi:Na+/proline symporter
VGPEFVSLLNPNSPVLNTPWALISIVWLLFIFPANPHLMSIVLALREPAEFTKFLLSAGACLLVFSLAPLTGLYARGMGLELEKADAAFPQFLLHVFPETVAFLLILAVLSAGLTTVSSLLVSLSGAFAHDLRTLVMGSRDAGISENRRLRLGRVGILLVAIVACAIALTRPPSLTILVWVGINGILSGVTGPLLGGIFLREPSRRAAVTSFLTGIATYLVCYPWLIKNVLAAGALAGVVGLVVMLLTHSLAPRAHAAP